MNVSQHQIIIVVISSDKWSSCLSKKQGRIHGNTVADGWAGAVMLKPIAIQKYFGRTDGRTDRPTRQGVESRVRD